MFWNCFKSRDKAITQGNGSIITVHVPKSADGEIGRKKALEVFSQNEEKMIPNIPNTLTKEGSSNLIQMIIQLT
jgi:hypothetical protein